jgi:hypothetical protein
MSVARFQSSVNTSRKYWVDLLIVEEETRVGGFHRDAGVRATMFLAPDEHLLADGDEIPFVCVFGSP